MLKKMNFSGAFFFKKRSLLFIIFIFIFAGFAIAETGSKDKIKIITGKVVVYNGSDEVYIVQNWQSRSKISYKVSGKLTGEVKQSRNKIIKVKGIVEKKNEWSGTIIVTEIIYKLMT